MGKNTEARKVKQIMLDVDWEHRLGVVVDSRERVGLAKVSVVIE